ncbi:glycosyltransferase family 4 protein [Bacillus sp. FJAT-49705]|uniref:Glycosyltransferase family 4 protein n=1 Tax=Cytobacillus citreus TaxID=2833586 RepID=A0ABS5NXT6_9BACI|nr:glycosyltransferase family 4 protein [Cytobacillus citreus]MBS4192616.1 glycosyltransferase family 4 protein [Cytobacillus citreus]
MKVCHITTVHAYNDIRIFVKECQSLAAAGNEVHLVAPNAPTERINGVFVHGIPKGKGNRLVRVTKTVRAVYKKAVEIDADVYHFHDPELILIGTKLKSSGKKVIYDVHEDVPLQIFRKKYIPYYLRKPLSMIVDLFEKNTSRMFDLIVCATPHISEKFEKYNTERISIRNYPKIEKIVESSKSNIHKRNDVCYIGGLSAGRGLYTMEEAIHYTSCSLNLAGVFFNQVDKARFIDDKTEKVKYLGYLERKEINDLLKDSLAGLVVLEGSEAFKYSLPVKMFEYMSAGIPVICSDFPLWREIIEKHKCGFCVDPKDAKAIGAAINYLNDNPEEAEQMGRNGRSAVETEYNWETESEKLINAYNNLFNQTNIKEVYKNENSNARSI